MILNHYPTNAPGPPVLGIISRKCHKSVMSLVTGGASKP